MWHVDRYSLNVIVLCTNLSTDNPFSINRLNCRVRIEGRWVPLGLELLTCRAAEESVTIIIVVNNVVPFNNARPQEYVMASSGANNILTPKGHTCFNSLVNFTTKKCSYICYIHITYTCNPY